MTQLRISKEIDLKRKKCNSETESYENQIEKLSRGCKKQIIQIDKAISEKIQEVTTSLGENPPIQPQPGPQGPL